MIADFTNFNVVTSDTVTGNVTLRLKDVPWDQALDIILQAKGLGLRKSGNVILIAPKDELDAKEKVELEAKQQIAVARAAAHAGLPAELRQGGRRREGADRPGAGAAAAAAAPASRILSPRGSVIFETRTNQLFVTDIPSKLEEVQALIAKIDIPVRQVLIEARIVDRRRHLRPLARRPARCGRPARRSRRRPGLQRRRRHQRRGRRQPERGRRRRPCRPAGGVNFADTTFVNLPATGANGFNPATFALSLFGASSNRFLNLEISALEADGKGKVVSSPRVVTADQQKALIEQGEELPYQVATSSGATSLQFRKANLKLEVTPQITPEGNVILDVDVNKDSVGRATTAGFAINTKHVKTQVLVENGGTVVIGGIFEQLDREDVTKVPFLGDLPYLGNLFKTRTLTTSKTELLIFLTPKVVTERTAAR